MRHPNQVGQYQLLILMLLRVIARQHCEMESLLAGGRATRRAYSDDDLLGGPLAQMLLHLAEVAADREPASEDRLRHKIEQVWTVLDRLALNEDQHPLVDAVYEMVNQVRLRFLPAAELLSLRQVTHLLGVHRPKVYEYSRAQPRRLHALTLNRHLYFERAEVLGWQTRLASYALRREAGSDSEEASSQDTEDLMASE
jgi:predicted DNA-binding transcriptional regulator AlpA